MKSEYRLKDARLGSGTDTGDGETDVDGRTHTTEEQFRFQEDLAIGDGNDIGGTVNIISTPHC
jgi:hypothetical protein